MAAAGLACIGLCGVASGTGTAPADDAVPRIHGPSLLTCFVLPIGRSYKQMWTRWCWMGLSARLSRRETGWRRRTLPCVALWTGGPSRAQEFERIAAHINGQQVPSSGPDVSAPSFTGMHALAVCNCLETHDSTIRSQHVMMLFPAWDPVARGMTAEQAWIGLSKAQQQVCCSARIQSALTGPTQQFETLAAESRLQQHDSSDTRHFSEALELALQKVAATPPASIRQLDALQRERRPDGIPHVTAFEWFCVCRVCLSHSRFMCMQMTRAPFAPVSQSFDAQWSSWRLQPARHQVSETPHLRSTHAMQQYQTAASAANSSDHARVGVTKRELYLAARDVPVAATPPAAPEPATPRSIDALSCYKVRALRYVRC